MCVFFSAFLFSSLLSPAKAVVLCIRFLFQVFYPEGYLERVYESVRAHGGLCIADEVQTGFGRVGSHFWAFEAQNVVPDIVTLGKPIGAFLFLSRPISLSLSRLSLLSACFHFFLLLFLLLLFLRGAVLLLLHRGKMHLQDLSGA